MPVRTEDRQFDWSQASRFDTERLSSEEARLLQRLTTVKTLVESELGMTLRFALIAACIAIAIVIHVDSFVFTCSPNILIAVEAWEPTTSSTRCFASWKMESCCAALLTARSWQPVV